MNYISSSAKTKNNQSKSELTLVVMKVVRFASWFLGQTMDASPTFFICLDVTPCSALRTVSLIGLHDTCLLIVARFIQRGCFTQPPMRRMRICFTDFFFVFCLFLFFPSVTKIPDNRSRERLNGFS